jgi:lysyl-tRNA synthetase class 2
MADVDARRRAGRDVPPLDEELLAALAAGLPDCAGVAVGIDRLIALATGQTDVASAMSFAHARPE